MRKKLYKSNTGNIIFWGMEMGSYEDSLRIKQSICATANQSIGYTSDGEKYSPGFCETKLEKGILGGACVLPIWSNKGKIYNTYSTWGNIKGAYHNGAVSAWSMVKHPGNYWNLEFVNGKVNKLESIMTKNTPQLPKGFKNQAAKELFEKLVKAKNPAEYGQIIQQNQQTYKKLCNILKRTAPKELTKLKNIANYNKMYGNLLAEYKAAQSTLMAGQNLPKGHIENLHKGFADSRLAENKWLQQSGKAGKKGVGFRAKTGAKLSSTTKKVMSASKNMRKFTRGVGKAGGWICVGLSTATAAMDCYSAYQVGKDKGEGWSNVGKQALKSGGRLACELGGAAAGQWLGAAIGQVLIPIPGVGAAIGGIVGSFAGMWLGSLVADNIPGLDKSVAEEEMEKQNNEQKEKVCKAMDEGDWQTVAEYTVQYKEQVVGEDGQPMVDENGNPVLKYITMHEDKEKQAKFEAELKEIDAWVEEKYAAEMKAQQEQLQEEAELQQQQMAQMGSATPYSLGYDASDTSFAGNNSGYGYGVGGNGYFAAQDSQQEVWGYGVGGNGKFPPSSSGFTGWQNPFWQDGLGSQFDNGGFNFALASNPFSYSGGFDFNGDNQFGPMSFLQFNKRYAA